MLLTRDSESTVAVAELVRRHVADVRAVHAGTRDLAALQAAKLVGTLGHAAQSLVHGDHLKDWLDPAHRVAATALPPGRLLGEVFPRIPLLERAALRENPRGALVRPVESFLHYYESSGTTGDPVAAPKALDDLVVNTVNIGEMWSRFLKPGSVALNLINGPFAPAGYQFEKVLEYLGVMSVRLWTDEITGDYTRVLRLGRELGVDIFVGAPSRLLELIQFSLSHGQPSPAFTELLLLAEQTGPSFQRHLEHTTGARARVCTFGSSETGTVAVVCEDGALHTQPQSYLLELHDERGTRPVAAGRADLGELVVTTLDLPSRPLVRYRTGDLVEISGAPCPCGLATPVLRPHGRRQDAVTLARGGIRQEDCEAALWGGERAPDEAIVLNYMLVVKGERVVCLVLPDREVSPGWQEALARRLAGVFTTGRPVVRAVRALPALASMGAYVGWKLSRLVDLDNPAMRDSLPPPLAKAVHESLAEIEALTGLPAPRSPLDSPKPA